MYPKIFEDENIQVNSLKAIEAVYVKLYTRYGNEFDALAHYKGAKTNFKSVYKTIEVKNRIEGLL